MFDLVFYWLPPIISVLKSSKPKFYGGTPILSLNTQSKDSPVLRIISLSSEIILLSYSILWTKLSQSGLMCKSNN